MNAGRRIFGLTQVSSRLSVKQLSRSRVGNAICTLAVASNGDLHVIQPRMSPRAALELRADLAFGDIGRDQATVAVRRSKAAGVIAV
jgi:hypothetical protein